MLRKVVKSTGDQVRLLKDCSQDKIYAVMVVLAVVVNLALLAGAVWIVVKVLQWMGVI